MLFDMMFLCFCDDVFQKKIFLFLFKIFSSQKKIKKKKQRLKFFINFFKRF